MNLRDLAKKLELSQTTVSRALNGYPEVREATRLRVLEAAKIYNYRANARAKGLATGRSMTIGHVLPASSRHEMVNPIFGDFISGVSEIYAQRGYNMLVSRSEDENIGDSFRKLASQGLVDGFVIQGPTFRDARIKVLTELGIPFVVHGRASDVTLDYSWVDVNNRRAFARATQFLIDLGHSRIGLINGKADFDFARRRERGYRETLEAHSIDIDQSLIVHDEMTEVYGHHAARDMLKNDNPPTAFLVSSLIPAIGVRRAIEEIGLKIGTDISVIIHDDDLSYLKNGQDVPIFTATRSSVREAGQIAAGILIDQIENPDQGTQQRLLEAQLVVGRSTGPASRSSD